MRGCVWRSSALVVGGEKPSAASSRRAPGEAGSEGAVPQRTPHAFLLLLLLLVSGSGARRMRSGGARVAAGRRGGTRCCCAGRRRPCALRWAAPQ